MVFCRTRCWTQLSLWAPSNFTYSVILWNTGFYDLLSNVFKSLSVPGMCKMKNLSSLLKLFALTQQGYTCKSSLTLWDKRSRKCCKWKRKLFHFWLFLSGPHWLSSGHGTCAVSIGSVKIIQSSVVFFLHDTRLPAQLEYLDFVECPGYH